MKIGPLLTKLWNFEILTKTCEKFEKSTVVQLKVSYMSRILGLSHFWPVRLFRSSHSLHPSADAQKPPEKSRWAPLPCLSHWPAADAQRPGRLRRSGPPLTLPLRSGGLLRAAARLHSTHFTVNFKVDYLIEVTGQGMLVCRNEMFSIQFCIVWAVYQLDSTNFWFFSDF